MIHNIIYYLKYKNNFNIIVCTYNEAEDKDRIQIHL